MVITLEKFEKITKFLESVRMISEEKVCFQREINKKNHKKKKIFVHNSMRIPRYRKLARRHRIILRISKGETADFLDFKSQNRKAFFSL
jgi:hypothetical protein